MSSGIERMEFSATYGNQNSEAKIDTVRRKDGPRGIRKYINKFIDRFSPDQQSKIRNIFSDMDKDSASLHRNLIRMHGSDLDNKKVGVFLLHYLQKSAGWDSKIAQDFGRPISATQELALQSYHRDYDARSNFLLNDLNNIIVESVNESDSGVSINPKEILFSRSPVVKETIAAYADVFDVKSESEFDVIIDKLIDSCVNGDGKQDDFVFVFIDSMVDKSLPFPERVKAVKELNQKLLERLEARMSQLDGTMDPTDLNNVKMLVRIRLGIVSQQDLHGHSILVMPHFQPAPGQSNPYTLANAFKQPFVRERVALGGHTPTMMQARSLMHELRGEALFSHVKGNNKKVKLQQFKSMREFLILPGVVSYSELGSDFRTQDKSTVSTVSLLSSANTRMLRALGDKLDQVLEDPDNAKVVTASLNRLAHLMEESVKHKDDHGKYSLFNELIAEELLLLLNITEPYEDGDFQEIFLENRERTLNNLYSKSSEKAAESGEVPKPRLQLDPTIQPVVLPMTSGMSCVDGVMRAMRQDNPGVKIACLSDNYFETFATLGKLSGHSITEGSAKPTFNQIDVNNIDGSIDQLKENGNLPDVVFFDLRSSPSIHADNYDTKKIESITDKLLEGRSADEPLTIALDVTLDKIHSKELNDFLCKYQDAIKDGRLNIVMYRSGHKFDQLGVDKFNAGYMEIYTADSQLRDHFSGLEGQLTGIDYQSLCHFHRNADYEIHQYLKVHYKNTDRAYEGMAGLRANERSFLQITPKSDKKLYYIEFTYPRIVGQAATFQSTLMEYASREAKKRGIQLVQRDSFGFNESSICIINSSKTRLSIGSHPQEEVDMISEIFNNFETAVQEALAELGEDLTEQNEEKFMKLLNQKIA